MPYAVRRLKNTEESDISMNVKTTIKEGDSWLTPGSAVIVLDMRK